VCEIERARREREREERESQREYIQYSNKSILALNTKI
jgi:hypothetical protein